MQQDVDDPNGGIVLVLCLQPTDDSEDILSFSEGIYSVAPTEGYKPLSFIKTPRLEVMAFPVQFSTGRNTMDENWLIKLTPCCYFKTRLCCVHDCFARDTACSVCKVIRVVYCKDEIQFITPLKCTPAY